jgi:hypothetical protein
LLQARNLHNKQVNALRELKQIWFDDCLANQ